MGRAPRPQRLGYVFAIAGIAAIVLLRLTFWDQLGNRSPIAPFVVPLLGAGWIGGWRPALLATALSLAVVLTLFFPTQTAAQLVETSAPLRVVMFLAFGAGVAALCGQLHRARRLSEKHAAAVQENEERIRLALDAANLGTWEWKLGTNEMHWSAETYALLGIPATEPPSRELFESVFDPEERERHRRAIDVGLATGHYECDLRLAHPDGAPGEIRHLAARGRVLMDENGRPERVLGVAGDVTAARRAEAALRATEARVTGILDSITDSVTAFDSELRFVHLNASARRLFAAQGLDPDCLVGKRIFQEAFVDLRDHELARTLERALRERVALEVEIYYEPWRRSFSGRAYPADGGGIVVYFQDVTERRDLRAEVERQARVFDTALSSIQDYVFIFDAAGRFRYANKPLLELWGIGAEQAYHKRMRDLGYAPEVEERLLRDVCSVLETARPITSLTPYTSPTGVSGTYETMLSPVLDADGRVVMVAGASRDVSARLQAEQTLRDADRRKDEFLAMLAHELRNPLAPIRNAVELQKLRAPSDPEIVWSRDVIDRQVQQMGRLLDDLLDVSRISRNKLALRRERVTLGEVIASAIETSQPLIKDAGHGLSVRLPEKPVWLDADPTRLSQVFSNVLNNAAKFMDDGGHITVTAELRDGVVEVRVRDRGVGIAPDVLPLIFDMFSQAAPALARSRDGIGIGLSLARGLVELHGGRIEARSAGPGTGSELVVRLPLAGAGAVRAAAEPVAESPARASRRRLLVADDLDDNAESLALVLRRMGHEVHTAHDGAEALEAARTLRPDVVLLDIGMPKLDGYEACRRIRAEPWGAQVFLIAITGWGQEEDRRRSEEAGFDRHLVKPIDPAVLARILRGEIQADRRGESSHFGVDPAHPLP